MSEARQMEFGWRDRSLEHCDVTLVRTIPILPMHIDAGGTGVGVAASAIATSVMHARAS